MKMHRVSRLYNGLTLHVVLNLVRRPTGLDHMKIRPHELNILLRTRSGYRTADFRNVSSQKDFHHTDVRTVVDFADLISPSHSV